MAFLMILGIRESLTVATVQMGSPIAPTESAEPTPSVFPELTQTPAPTLTPTITPTVTPVPTPTVIALKDKILASEQQESTLVLPVTTALLVNATTEEVLYSKHALEQIYPASITKLVTALTVLEQNETLDGLVTISKSAATPIPTAKMCGFLEEDQLFLKELVAAMLIYSGNDAAIAVAEHSSGSEEAFVTQMNQVAKDNGLESSVFCNPHGLPDDNHKTSAYDIYLIMEKLFHYDQFLGIIEMSSIDVNVLREGQHTILTFANTNQFLTGEYKLPDGLTLLGGKTGTTNKAGYCLAIYVTDPEGNCYIAEIYGAESAEILYSSMIQLLECISE